MFRAGLDDALKYLSSCNTIEYASFLKVHEILFLELYPWAGQDRLATAKNVAIPKAGILFCHRQDTKRAVEEGLRLGSNPSFIRSHPGEVIGLFAYGHPFLDGNGRAMLLIHNELCCRAGFSIAWQQTNKTAYLNALSQEIESPGKGYLDEYLTPFITAPFDRSQWNTAITDMRGLDGSSVQNTVDGDYSDARIMAKYQAFEQKRKG